MPINALGYLGIRSDQLDDWSDFASGLLGMQRIDRAGKQMAFRMDDLHQRLVVSDEPGETLAFMGWEVEHSSDLDAFGTVLGAAGHKVERGSRDLADRRFVNDLIVTHDPAGHRVELFHGPMRTDDPFVSGRKISGFKTDPFGMGHAVLHVKDADAQLLFYRDLLGFGVSDYMKAPMPMYFFHVNGRHHSFAVIGTGQEGFHHFMVEYTNLDDVGQGYDLAGQDDKVAFTLGRHTNDWATSYYAHTPSGFFVESGWGVRVIEPKTWEPELMQDGPSLWGHDRPYLPDDLRAQYTKMRLDNGAKGLQAPPPTDCPWLYGVLNGRGAH